MADVPALHEFEGKWRLSRAIKDRRGDADGGLSGEAVFSARPEGGLDYVETGTLTYAGQAPMEASRRYIWQEVPGGIAVRFEDGRDFHVIARDRLMPDAMHHCDPDMYHVSYDFSQWTPQDPFWRAIWRVVGPKKDYRMLSEYRRAPA